VARLDDELDRLRELVDGGRLADGAGLLGIELELHLIDDHARPAHRNDEVLVGLAGSGYDVQTELARFNLEVNLAPVALDDAPLTTIHRAIDGARTAASSVVPGTTAVSIGTLPTLEERDVTAAALSDRGRYRTLDERIMAAREGTLDVHIAGEHGERLDLTLGAITLEAAATSLQVHLDLPADGFVAAWNVAQAIAAVQVSIAANSPTVLGRVLWRESRVPLFEQLIDVRTAAQRDPSSRGAAPPRVWFGARWLEHPADLFAENLTHFRTPLVDGDDGDDEATPDLEDLTLAALVLHNGTVWRWNRPVYAVIGGRPTLRLENRVLSASPTSADAAADVALFAGLVAGLRDDVDRLTTLMPFSAAESNFRSAARHGLAAPLRWPGVSGTTTAGELLADGLIDVAADGLAALGVPAAEAGPALDVIAGRASEGRTGARWQLAALAHEEVHHDRRTALQRMLLRYRDLQAEGEPVHRWPWPDGAPRPRTATDATA
jgi:gamma-glutamyl:cysteine ligase YbdK (ATP-grasp superfamily)